MDQISTKKTYDEQLEEVVNILSDLPQNKDEIKIAAKLFYNKIFISLHYKPKQKFNGIITLITAQDKYELEDDYGMKPVSILHLYYIFNQYIRIKIIFTIIL